ncbi:hypothetical protein ABZ840_02875 [Streptomyces sp. NPDC047117]|uniref:hypothetical protein n=1 Tax=Streptomyces sp. NPDC047117 TaxID=3155379 RepID=UPI0033C7F4A2
MADVLKYGDHVHLQNGYNSWKGGYLDTNGHADGSSGGKYGVSTAESASRGKGTGTWEVLSAEGKANGTEVTSGDIIYLRNLYGGDGGYLDTNGHAPAPNEYEVLTSPGRDRAAGTGRWRVFADSSTTDDNKVRHGDVVRLLNGYNDWRGGFLDTCHQGPEAGLYGVSTSFYSDRGKGTGQWKFSKATA